MDFKPNYINAKKILDDFISKGLESYSSKRNFDFGPENKSNVSCLSPFIRKRIIHERTILDNCLKNNKFGNIEKFIQEIFWRTYWKGWLEGRSKVWEDYNKKLEFLKDEINFKPLKKDYLKAVNGNSGIDCFDSWVKELVTTGYLHNHSRMWFASIWIFTLNLPWELGADFFYKNLLDADPASNTLSWRWVAGLQTEGKIYLASEENIEKFSKFKFSKKPVLEKKPKLPTYINYTYIPPLFKEKETSNDETFLITLNNLIYSDYQIQKIRNYNVLFLDLRSEVSTRNVKDEYDQEAIKEYIDFLNHKNIKVKCLKEIGQLADICKPKKTIICDYPGVGYQLDKINEASKRYDIEVKFIYDQFDLMCWPYAKAGFFKFKKKIPFFLENIHN
ncbi:MAG: DNA photolyase [Rickettsiales bacterium]|nr:DNA photolyase [Rickettsiales bacterium]|tara:strand:- start:890 stop:2059 length:1170 start_codon:yes stop_codon:yes gene_type:complete